MTIKQIRYFLRRVKNFFKFQLIRFNLIQGYKPDITKTKINIGGGNWYKNDWENLDIIFNYKLEHQLLKPFKSNSINLIYTSHCIEHLKFETTSLLLNDCYRILSPGGILRIVIPDTDKLLDIYNHNKKKDGFKFYTQGSRAKYSLKESILELFGFNLYTNKFLDNSMHLSFYSMSSIKLLLIASGFNKLNNCSYGQSKADDFLITTENDINGFDNPGNDNMSLYIEAIK